MPRFLFAAAVAAALAAGCGGGGAEGGSGRDTTLLLDFQPNAVHAGIYLAAARGYSAAEGTALQIRKPGETTDAVKLLATGQADLAILDIHDLGLATLRGADLVGVMAIVQRPLAAVLAQPQVSRPRLLEGRRVGVTGLPSDDAVLDAVVEGDGGDPEKVRRVTIGFDAVKSLVSRRVDAATAFWNAEGVAVRAQRPGIREFRVDEFGAPAYPELVLVATRSTLDDREGDVRAVIRALQRGYEEVAVDPESAITLMLDAEPGLDRDRLAAELDAVIPAFEGGSPDVGRLDPERLRAWARWALDFGILERPVDPRRIFETTLVGASGR